MEHNGNISARASTDELASQSICATGEERAPPRGEPPFATEAEARAWRDGVTHGLRGATGESRRDEDEPVAPRDEGGEAAEAFDPSGRRLHHDGWSPARKARFLLVLVAGGVVADACRAAGMSVASAYALRNRRSGRAFGRMWEAILIHRARCRLADNNLSRAMDGYAERIVKEGVVVAERHRFDNRLSMAMLTRLDRLAESKSGEEVELLRALSLDFEDYIEVVETGGDEDAFVEARRPGAEAATVERKQPWYQKDMLDALAATAGYCPWRHVAPPEIPVSDLNPDRMDDWGFDGWVRAIRSYYLDWLELHRDSGEPLPDGPDCPAAYDRVRRDIMAGMAAAHAEEPLNSSPGFPGRNEDEWQPSTSSTSRANRHARRRSRKLARRRRA